MGEKAVIAVVVRDDDVVTVHKLYVRIAVGHWSVERLERVEVHRRRPAPVRVFDGDVEGDGIRSRVRDVLQREDRGVSILERQVDPNDVRVCERRAVVRRRDRHAWVVLIDRLRCRPIGPDFCTCEDTGRPQQRQGDDGTQDETELSRIASAAGFGGHSCRGLERCGRQGGRI